VPAKKIQDEGEVIRWIEQGKTYAWMSEEYLRKYNIETTPSLWSNFRRRHGLDRRIARNDDLIPWEVKREHRWRYPLAMLRHEARQRSGLESAEGIPEKLAAWKANMEAEGVVVHYDPDTEDGFFYVPRRKGIDTDLIRVPDRKTTKRRAAD